MNDATETALLALADPIPWGWHARASPSEGGEWYARLEKTTYLIRVLAYPDDVDTPPSLREQKMTIDIGEEDDSPEESIEIPYASVAEAKKRCLRHAFTGETTEVRALKEAYDNEENEYQKQVAITFSKLDPVCRRYDPPRLPWQTERAFPIEYTFTGERGKYHVHFEPERRWVVRFVGQEQKQVVAEHCFFTREITRLACSLHSHCGEWHGMFLIGNPPVQLQLFH